MSYQHWILGESTCPLSTLQMLSANINTAPAKRHLLCLTGGTHQSCILLVLSKVHFGAGVGKYSSWRAT